MITEKLTLLLFSVEFGKVKVAVLSPVVGERGRASAKAAGQM